MNTEVVTAAIPASDEASGWIDVARIILPVDDIDEVLPLYLELPEGTSLAASGIRLGGRRSLTAEQGVHVSLGTYFNAFPASYWRRYTSVLDVRLSGSFSGRVGVQVWKSSARGRCSIYATAICNGDFTFDLPIRSFVDGGFYWLEFTSLEPGSRLDWASWRVPKESVRVEGTFSIGITTFNRASYCLRQLRTIAGDTHLRDQLDTVYVVDQGTDLVRDQPSFAEVSTELGPQLTMLRQGNLGGSGGFSRAMAETLRAKCSEYVLLLDDDAIMEPESVTRAVAFANFATESTIVGGGMIHLDKRAVLYAQGERVDFANARSSGNRSGYDLDFGTVPLREAAVFHGRAESDFNGWWMCLIPRAALSDLGLSLPLFLKWDDLEYGIRARRHGIPTASLPGVAVWHLAWHDKNPIRTWEEYFSHRNTWLGMLVMSPTNSAMRLPRVSFSTDVLQVLCLQYSSVQVRNVARREVLAGLAPLHSGLGEAISHARGLRAGFGDAVSKPSVTDFPAVQPPRGSISIKDRVDVRNGFELVLRVATELLRHMVAPVRQSALQHPERTLGSTDLSWWELEGYDSALITAQDGSGYTWAKRDPRTARKLLAESLRTNLALKRSWPRLAAQVRSEATSATSLAAWEATFGAAEG